MSIDITQDEMNILNLNGITYDDDVTDIRNGGFGSTTK